MLGERRSEGRGAKVQVYIDSEVKHAVKKLIGQIGGSESEVAAELIGVGLNNLGVPIVGSIHAGDPVTVSENVEGHLNPGTALSVQPERDFFLRVDGDCMASPRRADGGIRDGEFVLMRRGEQQYYGDVVAAVIRGEEAVLRRYCHRPGERVVKLEPYNDSHAVIDLPVEDVEILAVCKGKATLTGGEWHFSPRCG